MAKKTTAMDPAILSVLVFRAGWWFCTDNERYKDQKSAYMHQLSITRGGGKSSQAITLESLAARIEELEKYKKFCNVEIGTISVSKTSEDTYNVTDSNMSFTTIERHIKSGKQVSIEASIDGDMNTECLLSIAAYSPSKIIFLGARGETTLYLYSIRESGTREFKEISLGEGTGQALLTRDLHLLGIDCLAAEDGTTWEIDTPIEQVLQDILTKVVDVNVVQPSINALTVSPTSMYVGDTANISLSTVSFTDGKFTGEWLSGGYVNAGCEVTDRTSTMDGGSVPSSVTASEPHTYKFKTVVSYSVSTAAPTKNNGDPSSKNIPAGSLPSNEATLNAYWPYFTGELDKGTTDIPYDGQVTASDIRALTKRMITSSSTTVISSMTEPNKYYRLVAVPVGYHIEAKNKFGADFELEEPISGIMGVIDGITKEYLLYYIQGRPTISSLIIKSNS